VIEATQWFKNGDHPQDDCQPFTAPGGARLMSEGKAVRYYRTPDGDGDRLCEKCSVHMHNHGWVDTLEGGHIACPGDWIITGVANERYPCKDEIFRATYDSVEEQTLEA
jgi:hypothetical protein